MSTLKNASVKQLVLLLVAGFPLSLLPAPAHAAEGFSYPELQVAPRASERLAIEARRETDRRWFNHIPVQISALATLAASATLFSSSSNRKEGSDLASARVGALVGSAWIATTLLLSNSYTPYSSQLGEIQSLPSKDTREQLVKERMAEEALERAAAVGKRLSLISAVTEGAASIYMLSNSRGSSAGVALGGIALITAFAPIVFPYSWQTVAYEQQDYKRKIYAPLASLGFSPEPSTERLVPTLTLSARF